MLRAISQEFIDHVMFSPAAPHFPACLRKPLPGETLNPASASCPGYASRRYTTSLTLSITRSSSSSSPRSHSSPLSSGQLLHSTHLQLRARRPPFPSFIFRIPHGQQRRHRLTLHFYFPLRSATTTRSFHSNSATNDDDELPARPFDDGRSDISNRSRSQRLGNVFDRVEKQVFSYCLCKPAPRAHNSKHQHQS
jgi:hypothetical protein